VRQPGDGEDFQQSLDERASVARIWISRTWVSRTVKNGGVEVWRMPG
jgi:hypothetical protein